MLTAESLHLSMVNSKALEDSVNETSQLSWLYFLIGKIS